MNEVKIKLRRTGVIKTKTAKDAIEIEVDPNLIVPEKQLKPANVKKDDAYAKTYKTTVQDKKKKAAEIKPYRILFSTNPADLDIVDERIEKLKKEIKQDFVFKTTTVVL